MPAWCSTKVLLGVTLFVIFLLSKEVHSSDPCICGPHQYVFNNTCVCKTGYKDHKNGTCEPICEKGCPKKSYCSSPGQCCPENYKFNETNHHCEPICPKGYELRNNTCQTLCPKGCPPTAHCVAHDTCACPPDYRLLHDRCIPLCLPSCGLNSFCKSPNHCECHKGFKLKDNKCIPTTAWWVYLVIVVLVLLIVVCIVGIICYFVTRARRINYYPNNSFADTTAIVS